VFLLTFFILAFGVTISVPPGRTAPKFLRLSQKQAVGGNTLKNGKIALFPPVFAGAAN
jgi:hypothetical protein